MSSMTAADFDEPAFLARLRDGEPDAYRLAIRRFHSSLINVAASVIGSRAQAEEVVQDTWLAVYSGIGKFEGRCGFASWLFRIAINRARTRIGREGRMVGLPAILDGPASTKNTNDSGAFTPNGDWAQAPRLWNELHPERIAEGRELWKHAQDAIDALPPGQRAVLVLHDREGRDTREICELLSITPENQRVLLHRARTRIRDVLDGLASIPGTASAGTRQARRAPEPGPAPDTAPGGAARRWRPMGRPGLFGPRNGSSRQDAKVLA